MPFAIPVIVAIATPTMFTIAAAALSVVGAITKNDKLTKLGGMIGMAGAFAGLASAASSGLSSGAGELAGDAAVNAGGLDGALADSAANYTSGMGAENILTGTTAAPTSIAEAVMQGGDVTQVATDAGGSALAGDPAASAMAADATAGQAISGAAPPSPTSPAAENFLGGASGGTMAGPAGAVGGATVSNGPQGLIDSIMNPARQWWNSQGDFTKASIIKAGGDFIAGGMKRDANGEYVDFQREEAARRNANANNVGTVNLNGLAPNPNANLYPGGRYVAPRVGFINKAMN